MNWLANRQKRLPEQMPVRILQQTPHSQRVRSFSSCILEQLWIGVAYPTGLVNPAGARERILLAVKEGVDDTLRPQAASSLAIDR